MSSGVQSLLIGIQQNNYAFVAVLTVVVYDHLLTFSDEVEYIWTKPWTFVSSLFILVRYVGLCGYLIPNFIITALPGYVGVKFLFCLWFEGEILFIVFSWGIVIFFNAADLTMMLRVWAVFNRSRLTLGFLLVFILMDIVSAVATAIVVSVPNRDSPSIVRILNFSIFLARPNSFIWPEMAIILQMVSGAVLCSLVVIKFMKQSLGLYRATGHWKLSQIMNLFIGEGIIYFIAFSLSQLVNILIYFGALSLHGWGPILAALSLVPTLIIAPLFILSIRRLCARTSVQGSGAHMDTAFGLSSSHGGFMSTVVFANVEEGIEMPVVGDGGPE